MLPLSSRNYIPEHDQQVSEFDQVYDARKALRAKRDMKKLEVGFIKTNDIVLVEALIRRYVPREDNKKVPPGWPYWKCTFDLTAISVLLKAPTNLPARVDDAAVEVDL